jgi:hypothetical protein
MESDSRSSWAFGLSLVEVMLLLVFAAMMVSVTDSVEGRGQGTQEAGDEPDGYLQSRLDAAMETKHDLEQQLNEMTLLVNDVKLLMGAKGATKEGFQEAIENLKRGYALCQKSGNTLIEASVLNGAESIQVIGDMPVDLRAGLSKGDQTSDLEQIITFLQDVYEYEKDQNCRFNYRLKFATDNDYRKAREGLERYFYPEKIFRTG